MIQATIDVTPRNRRNTRGRRPPGLLALLAALAAGGLLPQPGQTIAALAAIILLGVPHGALDGEIARPLLRPRLGRAWFPVFALVYLSLAAGVLVAWRTAPMPTLAGFLAASVWHFGHEDAGPRPLGAQVSEVRLLEVLVRGGLPVAVPTLLHPTATAHLFGTAAIVPMSRPPDWLLLASAGWCVAAACWAIRVSPRRPAALREPLALAGLFAALPPLTAFAGYFVCVHAPRHIAALVADPRAPRVVDMQAALWRSAPIAGLTILIGAALWRLFPGEPADRLVTLTLQGLAALTLPHMLLDWRSARLFRARPPQPLVVSGPATLSYSTIR